MSSRTAPVARCDICDLPMYKRKDLKKHKRTEGHRARCQSMGIYCSDCKKCFESSAGLQAHNTAVHVDPHLTGHQAHVPPEQDLNTENPLPWFVRCECGETFPMSRLEAHLNAHATALREIHVTMFPFTSSECEEVLPTEEEMNDHPADEPSLFRCDDCGEIFGGATSLLAHVCAPHGQKDDEKHAGAATEDTNIDYTAAAPAPKKWKICKICGLPSRRKHKKSPEHVAACVALDSYCVDCKVPFESAERSQAHWSRVHDPERPTEFPCGDCGVIFPTEKSLRKHNCRRPAPAEAAPEEATFGQAIRCEVCDRPMPDTVELRMHKRSAEHIEACKRISSYCSDCQRCFNSGQAFKFHRNIAHGEILPTVNGLEQHHANVHDASGNEKPTNPTENNVGGSTAAPKTKGFCKIYDQYLYEKLKIHTKSGGHMAACKKVGAYCHDCKTCLSSPEKYQSHWARVHDPNRVTEFHCCDCDKSFLSNKILNRHLRGHAYQMNNKKFACAGCGKVFFKKKQREQHIRECLAAAQKAIHCLGGEKCKRTFQTPSAMIMHLESGACASKIDRRTINEVVREHDVHCGITLPTDAATLPSQLQQLLQVAQEETVSPIKVEILSDSDSDSECGGIRVYTPSVSSSEYSQAIITPVGTSPWQCTLCLKGFKSYRAMEMHVNSLIHEPFSYHCPLQFMGLGVAAEERSFKSLSALVQHLERGACKGGEEIFRKTIALVEQVAQSLGFDGLTPLTGSRRLSGTTQPDEIKKG